jgi:hypothetical protein
MQSCQVCGRSFDPLGFQVVVPELGRGFDGIDCAKRARASAGPRARIIAAPLVAVAETAAAAALAPPAAAARRALFPAAATLGLLAAGTAVAGVLWAGVLGADTSSFSLGPFRPPPAFSHETVQAEAASAPTPVPTPQSQPAEQPATVTLERVVFVPSIPAPSPIVLVPHSGNARPASRTAHPTRPEPTESGPGKSTGKGHAKKGKGHEKHGDGPGSNHGHGKSNGHGKGKH